jgi:hypothetical protein
MAAAETAEAAAALANLAVPPAAVPATLSHAATAEAMIGSELVLCIC